MATPLEVGIVTDVGAIANAAASVFKLIDGIIAINNTPEMMALRQQADVQAAIAKLDADLKAAQGGDKAAQNKVDQEVSG